MKQIKSISTHYLSKIPLNEACVSCSFFSTCTNYIHTHTHTHTHTNTHNMLFRHPSCVDTDILPTGRAANFCGRIVSQSSSSTCPRAAASPWAWSVGRSVGQFVDWFVVWLVGRRLVVRLFGSSVDSMGGYVVKQAGWMVG